MSTLYVNKQTEAEKDEFLLDCFHDTGVIKDLVESSYTILSGRKGAGKSAVARYLEKNTKKYGVDFAYRLSIRNFNILRGETKKDTLDSILSYIIIKTAQKMLNINYFKDNSVEYWKDFLLSNGLQQVSDYESFVASQKTHKTGFSVKAFASAWFAKGQVAGQTDKETVKERSFISNTPSSLYESLRQSVSEDESIVIFIDDISDYLDESDENAIKEDISIIQDLLLRLQAYNLSFVESDLKVRFVSLVREDLFDYMEGSNTNKLKTDSLALEWTEKDFASLLIRRMPYFKDNLENALVDPVASLKLRFPDEIFVTFLKNFNTHRYISNFYAYMAAISFNRPRDFLQFCYALRDRLSPKQPATFENIDAAEIEYSDYFIQELRDELYVASRVFHYELSQERINQLVDMMSKKESFNSSELKANLSTFIGHKTSVGNKKIELLVSELWRYGVIGVSEKPEKMIKPSKTKTPEKTAKFIRFKYLSDVASFTPEKIKSYAFYLHRGLWWFAKKRRNK